MPACPYCASSHLTRDGHDQRGRAVRACRVCGRHSTRSPHSRHTSSAHDRRATRGSLGQHRKLNSASEFEASRRSLREPPLSRSAFLVWRPVHLPHGACVWSLVSADPVASHSRSGDADDGSDLRGSTRLGLLQGVERRLRFEHLLGREGNYKPAKYAGAGHTGSRPRPACRGGDRGRGDERCLEGRLSSGAAGHRSRPPAAGHRLRSTSNSRCTHRLNRRLWLSWRHLRLERRTGVRGSGAWSVGSHRAADGWATQRSPMPLSDARHRSLPDAKPLSDLNERR